MAILKLAFIGSLRIVFMGSLKIALFLYAIFLSDTPSAGVPEGNGYVGGKEGSMLPRAEKTFRDDRAPLGFTIRREASEG
jgi:hypothetical protein